MTEKQASAWVDANCRFAMIESIKDMVKTSAMRSGIKLNDQEADFYAVKAIVYASLVTAAMNVEDVLKQYYGFGEDALNVAIKDAVEKSRTREDAVAKIIGALDAKTRGKPGVPPINWASDATKSMIHGKVLQYIKQADPAALYGKQVQQFGLGAGPHRAGEDAKAQQPPQRARLGPGPNPIPKGPALTTQPSSHGPIPRTPAGQPLPPAGKTRKPFVPPGRGPVPALSPAM